MTGVEREHALASTAKAVSVALLAMLALCGAARTAAPMTLDTAPALQAPALTSH